MKLKVRKIMPVVSAVEVKGRQLAPAIYQFDNLYEVEEICRLQYISWEDVVCDETSGLIKIPDTGSVRIGQYLVEDDDGLKVFDSLEDLQVYYKVVEE